MKKISFELLPWLLGILVASWVIGSFTDQQVKFEEAALGEETSSYFAIDDGIPIHNCGYAPDADSFLLAGWQLRGAKQVVFFIGNSQTHGVNRMKSGDVNYVQMLHDENAAPGFDIMANSVPNGNLQEFYLIYAHYAELLPIRTLFVPVFLDDLRETGIRKFYFDKMHQTPLALANDSAAIARKIDSEIAGFNREESANGELAGLDKTTQAVAEEALNESLNQHWSAWNNREQIRGTLFNSLYQLRNTALGINAQTHRKIMPGTYQSNLSALDALCRLATHNKTRIVLYIPPLRNDIAPPYDANEYARFKEQLASFCQSRNAELFNFEQIVPGPQWGLKASTKVGGEPEYDFMHFTADGHRLLANALKPLLANPSVSR